MHLPAMRPFILAFRGFVVLSVVVVAAALSVAQQPPGADISKWTKIEFTGPFQGAQQNMVVSATFEQKPMYVFLSPHLKTLIIKGTAEPSAIKSGMYVRFTGKFTAEPTIEGKVTEMYVFSPQGDLPTSDPDTDMAEIAGKVIRNDLKGKIDISVLEKISEKAKKPRSLSLELAEDAKIFVDVSDLRLASVGDSMTITGRKNKIGPKRDKDAEDQIVAESIIIDMANPLTGLKKKKGPAEKPEKKDAFEQGAKAAEGAPLKGKEELEKAREAAKEKAAKAKAEKEKAKAK